MTRIEDTIKITPINKEDVKIKRPSGASLINTSAR